MKIPPILDLGNTLFAVLQSPPPSVGGRMLDHFSFTESHLAIDRMKELQTKRAPGTLFQIVQIFAGPWAIVDMAPLSNENVSTGEGEGIAAISPAYVSTGTTLAQDVPPKIPHVETAAERTRRVADEINAKRPGSVAVGAPPPVGETPEDMASRHGFSVPASNGTFR